MILFGRDLVSMFVFFRFIFDWFIYYFREKFGVDIVVGLIVVILVIL